MFEDRRLLSRLQINGDKAVFLLVPRQLAVFRQIGRSGHGEIGLPEGNTAQRAAVFLALVLRLPACKDPERPAGERPRDERRCGLAILLDERIEAVPIFRQRAQVAEAGAAGAVIVPAAALITRNIGCAGHRIVGLNIGMEHHIPLPEPAGRRRIGHVDGDQKIFLRDRVSRDGGLRRGRLSWLRALRRRAPLPDAFSRRRGIAAGQKQNARQEQSQPFSDRCVHLFSLPFLQPEYTISAPAEQGRYP